MLTIFQNTYHSNKHQLKNISIFRWSCEFIIINLLKIASGTNTFLSNAESATERLLKTIKTCYFYYTFANLAMALKN